MSIGGQLDHRAYERLARKHQPADLRVAIRTLAAQGLKAADIARLLEVSECAVVALLARPHIGFEKAAAVHADAWRSPRPDGERS